MINIGELDETIALAVDAAIHRGAATVVRRDDGGLVVVIADTLLVELMANGTALEGGTVVHRDDGRAVRIYPGLTE
jgi:hypothetical protein